MSIDPSAIAGGFSATSAAASDDLLAVLGWGEAYSTELSADCRPGDFPGRVIRVDRGTGVALTGQGEITAAYSGQIRRAAAADPVDLPCVGDWAVLREVDGGRVEIVRLLPRRTSFLRAGAGRSSHGQVLAANIDVAFIVEAAVPDPDLARIERLLALTWQSGSRPVVLLSKCDLAPGELPWLLDQVLAVAPGTPVYQVAAESGDGIESVRGELTAGTTAVMLGQSGAGKSTLVNALAGVDVMDTGRVRGSDGRGRHTTTHRELVMLPDGGLIVDTPGIRTIGMHMVADGLAQVFADIDELVQQCRFNDCEHRTEPGCAVLAAVESGDLAQRRLASWRKLQREAEWEASRTDARLRAERAKRWRNVVRDARGRSRP